MSKESNFHWEPAPHEYEHYTDYDGMVIVCDYDDCDYVATAYASQFVVHEMRHHE